jgi:hypothetical protein
MLLTLQSGLQRLTPRAQSVPAYAQVLRHSSIALSRRTRISWSCLESCLMVARFHWVTLLVFYPRTRLEDLRVTHVYHCPADPRQPDHLR